METYRLAATPRPPPAPFRLYTTGVIPFWVGNVFLLAVPAFCIGVGDFFAATLLAPAYVALLAYTLTLTTRVSFVEQGLVVRRLRIPGVRARAEVIPWPERVAVKQLWTGQFQLILRYGDRSEAMPHVVANDEEDVRQLALRIIDAHRQLVLEK